MSAHTPGPCKHLWSGKRGGKGYRDCERCGLKMSAAAVKVEEASRGQPPTPGPWKMVADGLGSYHIDAADGRWFATVGQPRKNEKPLPVAANARLIAAAPELLEVVREARELLNDAESCHVRGSAQDCAWYERRGDAVAKAAAVLARVEGE